MLSYPKWVQMHGPTLAEVILHDPQLGEKKDGGKKAWMSMVVQMLLQM